MSPINCLLASRKGAARDGGHKGVHGVLEAAEPRHLAHAGRCGDPVQVSSKPSMGIQERRLPHHIKAPPLCQQKVALAEELHLAGKLSAGLASPFCDGPQLLTVGGEQREDKVGLPELRAIEHAGLHAICASPRQEKKAYSSSTE